jgi:tRNA (mo5U34)-methyltransferase
VKVEITVKRKIQLRDDLTAAFGEYLTSASAKAANRIVEIARCSPGTRPQADFRDQVPGLERLREQTGDSLTARITLADTLFSMGEEQNANQLYRSVIRSLRPSDQFSCAAGVAEQIRKGASGQPIWHSIDLGNDFIEGRRKTSKVLAHEMLKMNLPDLTGKTVLDIGAFGGWFSFEAERRGAKSVTALDYYSWAVDYVALHKWMNEQHGKGLMPDPYHPPAHVIDEARQPGRIVFDLTRSALNSDVTPNLGVFEDSTIEPHDIVFHLGVLYHCDNPLLTLRKVASVTREMLILETLGVYVPGCDRPLWEFYGDNSINNDVTTWWAPSEAGLVDMLIAAGFKHVEVSYGDDTIPSRSAGAPQAIRIWARAWK